MWASVAQLWSRDDEEIRARHVGFFDGNASNFLIAYAPARPYIKDVKSIPAMIAKGRTTRQRLRDLNSYGPRHVKSVDEASPAATVADKESGPEAEQPVAAAVVATPDEGVTK